MKNAKPFFSSQAKKCPVCKTTEEAYFYTRSVLKFCKYLDDPISDNINCKIDQINFSIFKNYPMVRYRKLKLIILYIRVNSNYLNSVVFYNILKDIASLIRSCPYYWIDILEQLKFILPSSNFFITKEQYRDIKKIFTNNCKNKDIELLNLIQLQVNEN